MDRESATRCGDYAFRLLGACQYEQALAIYLELAAAGYGPVSAHLGYIYDHMQPRDKEKARQHYSIAVQEGDVYAMYAMAGLMAEEGNLAGAVFFYDRAIRGGEKACCYPLYLTLRKLGAITDANIALDAAAAHGNPFAIRDQSFRRLSGKEGFRGIFRGAAQYIGNLPALTRAALQLRAERNRDG
jgi:TPR repeat protein